MTSLAFDLSPLDVHMIQRVTHSTPPVTITSPEQHCVPYDVLSESNRESYLAQSAATHDGKVAEFRRR